MIPNNIEFAEQFEQNWTNQLAPQTIENASREAGLTWRKTSGRFKRTLSPAAAAG